MAVAAVCEHGRNGTASGHGVAVSRHGCYTYICKMDTCFLVDDFLTDSRHFSPFPLFLNFNFVLFLSVICSSSCSFCSSLLFRYLS